MDEHTQAAPGGGEEEKELEEQQRRARANKLGTMPVGRLLVSMSVPIMLSMLVQALYNVVDSIFVARLGEEAIAAVGFAFPVQMLMIGVGVGTGVGMASLLGRRLGEKDVRAANRAATNGIFLAVMSWLAFALFGLLFAGPFFAVYTNSPQMSSEIGEMGVAYLQIVTVGSLGVILSIMLERLLQATGRTVFSMVSQMTGAVINIILDPILIFGLLGAPKLGVAGAAWATIIGQFAGMGLNILFNLVFNKDIRLSFKGFRPHGNTIRHIYRVGIPGIVMQTVSSLMTFFMNHMLVPYGTTAVSVFTIYYKLQSFIFMPAFGLNNGMIPIIAFNYGARNRARITATINLGMKVQLAVLTAGTVLFWAAPGLLLRLFDAQPAMMDMGVSALRIISVGFPFAAVSIAFTGIFQALGRGFYSLVMSVVRQVVFLLPLAWLLAKLAGGLPALWFAFPVSEVGAALCGILLYRDVWKKTIATLGMPAGQ